MRKLTVIMALLIFGGWGLHEVSSEEVSGWVVQAEPRQYAWDGSWRTNVWLDEAYGWTKQRTAEEYIYGAKKLRLCGTGHPIAKGMKVVITYRRWGNTCHDLIGVQEVKHAEGKR